ncbi:ABC transporter permease [Saccharopolyspora sp. K220]|uniref:ABC transporter permease n=1 Tax=Saccharopolyspora soli TaxID=2926618 RepID=UPI001F55B49E|nr:ABC transporter permease [Saccharopolyspora soli]MCI2422622.1 ABC transporter permease [Saccharopolyspora soli]
MKTRLGWAPFIPFAFLILIAAVGPMLIPFDPERVAGAASQPPGGDFLFGTDATGMDVFSRTIGATRINLLLALLVTLSATVFGVLLGLIIGMNESRRGPVGWLGRGGNRIVDLSDAVPALIVGVVVVGLFGASLLSLTVALALVLMPNQIRLTRVEVLKVRHDAYLDAARMAGLSEGRITLRHVLPNSCRPALENASFVFGLSIIVSASLGFLGLGLRPPTPEWGAMVALGVSDVMLGRWWTALFPAAALCVAVASAAGAAGTITRLSRGAAAG